MRYVLGICCLQVCGMEGPETVRYTIGVKSASNLVIFLALQQSVLLCTLMMSAFGRNYNHQYGLKEKETPLSKEAESQKQWLWHDALST